VHKDRVPIGRALDDMPDPSYVGRRPTTPELFASHGAGLHVCSMTIVPDLVQLWQRNTELRESMNGGASRALLRS